MSRSFLTLCATVAAATGLSPAVAADGSTALDAEAFGSCLGRLEARARGEGISDPVIADVLRRVSPVERVIELDRRQPEFTRTFADYYLVRVTPERVERGRRLVAEHRPLLERLTRRYGIPPHYLVAFWGLETNFGRYFGKMPVPASLATLACDPRRSAFFADELMAALRIIDAGDIDAERMQGSWAGAMGHMQFLPSVYLRYAIDADDDGRRDLWESVPDALASAANFLAGLGWQRELRWGREVRLPRDFDYSLAGRDVEKPLSAWAELGIRDAFGRALPPLALPASVLVPAGHDGPAFIVYENFDVIMRWNRSEYYALAVGRLADRIAGGGPLVREPVANGERVSREQVMRLQEDLARLGFDPGEADGIFGPATRRALREFQKRRNLVADGHLDADALAAVEDAVTG